MALILQTLSLCPHSSPPLDQVSETRNISIPSCQWETAFLTGKHLICKANLFSLEWLVLLVLEDASRNYCPTLHCGNCTVTRDSLAATLSLMSLQGFICFLLTWGTINLFPSLITSFFSLTYFPLIKLTRCHIINIFPHCTRWCHQIVFA